MQTAIPTDLLQRLINATPQQYAAVEKILSAVPLEGPAPVDLNVAQAAFALLVKLDAQAACKKPSLLTVFRWYCIEGLSAEQIATKCRTSKATVIRRLRLIDEATNTKPEQFRAMSDHLQQMADNYDRSGAREIYRRGLANGDES